MNHNTLCRAFEPADERQVHTQIILYTYSHKIPQDQQHNEPNLWLCPRKCHYHPKRYQNIHKYPMVDFFTFPLVGHKLGLAIPHFRSHSSRDPEIPGQEDSDDSGEAAFLGPPNAEPLQHIVHREAEATGEAVRLLGLETVSFQKSIWDAAVIVMLHAGGGARKVVGNFNVALTKIGEFGCVFVWEGLIGSLRKVLHANGSLLETSPFGRESFCSGGPCEPPRQANQWCCGKETL